MSSSIYDAAFDTTSLEAEMAQALEADRKYKLTDAMKKRAITKAANYDEFKVCPSLYSIVLQLIELCCMCRFKATYG